jgi:hypothetical protein
MDKQPLIIDVFPKTGFAAGNLTGKAEVKVGADLKFGESSPATATGGANASLAYNYAPSYANVISGFGSGSAFWQFTRTQTAYPVGDIPLKLIVAVPKGMTARSLTASMDVRVEYSGGWLQAKGLSVAAIRTRIELPNE